jgi:hypothetical protein
MEKNTSKEMSANMQKTAETMSSTIPTLLDKLAGKQSDIKLSFQDLTLETGMTKIVVNGSIVLDIVYSKEAKEA